MGLNIEPLKIPVKLAPTPKSNPKYYVEVSSRSGEKKVLADPKASRALLALMDQHAVNGGAACHWGGPAALAELMSALHTIMFQTTGRQWYEAFNFINDIGHAENGLYALRALWEFDNLKFSDLKGFRSIESKLTGHGEAHLNPEQILLSNGPLGSSVAQAQGLCFADKLLKKERTTVLVLSDGAAMEGETKEAMCAIAGLAQKGKMNPFVMMVSDNNTKLSGRIDQDSYSMERSFSALAELGWKMIKLENGHDLTLCLHTLEQAIEEAQSNTFMPVCVWAKTIKGYGVKSTMEGKSGGHGFPLKKYDPKIVDFIQEIYDNKAPLEFLTWAQELAALAEVDKKSKEGVTVPEEKASVKKEKIQVGVASALIEAAKSGLPVFSVSADLQGSTGVAAFHKEFPENFIDIGVAEANMVSMASGLSKCGLIPVVDTFAQFGITKGLLPLTMGLLSESPVVAIFSHTGFQDAADGASHQATTYFSAINALPNTVVTALSCSEEAHALVLDALKKFSKERKNYVFFLGREDFPSRYENDYTLGQPHTYSLGKAQILAEGKDLLIVTCGSLVGEALEAASILAEQKIQVGVINSSCITHPDIQTIRSELRKSASRLLTVEDHQIIGGMGANLIHQLVLAKEKFMAQGLGINNSFGQSAYKSMDLYKKHGLDRHGIVKAVKELL